MALDNLEGPPTQVGGDKRAIGVFLGIFEGHNEPLGCVGADIQPCTPSHRYDLSTTSDADGVGRPRMSGQVGRDVTDSPKVFNRAHRARHPVQCAGMICCNANCCRDAMVSGISRSIAAPARCKPPSTPYSGTSGNVSRVFSRTLTIPACEHELKTMSPFPCTLTAT